MRYRISSPTKNRRFGNVESNSLILKFALALTFGFATFFTSSASADDLTKPTRADRLVSRLVAQLMEKDHLSSRALNDNISNRAFDQFIKTLDPMKVYFLKSDIAEFEKWKSKLDDQMVAGEFSAALEVYTRFLARVNERTDLAIELVDAEHDFDLQEDMVTDADLLDFPADEAEAKERWRKRIKYSLLVLQGDEDDKETEKDDEGEESAKKKKKTVDPKEQLRKRYKSFARRMNQSDTEDVVEMYITAVTSSFDPHTSYMSKGSFENFLIQMGLELEGIGATLAATDDGYTVIKNIVPGGAAATQGGLKVEDKIIAVGQGDEDEQRLDAKLFREHGSEFVDATGMRLDDVVGMIRGKAGTVVRLSVTSENEEGVHTVEIVRERIKLEESAAHGQVFEEDGKKIGIVKLPSFYADMGGRNGGGRSTTRDVSKILTEFNSQNVDAVVLDLRNNGGGSLREAIDCTGLFIDIGPVVQVKDSYGNIDKHNDEARGEVWKGPLVVVTNKFSASASEILAGAVQDYNRGLVIGDTTTHGKGTVQSLVNLNELIYKIRNPKNDFGALKITMQQFYRPNGDSTQKRGVLSDLVLPSITDKMDVGEADLDYPVEFDRVPRASFKGYTMVDSEIKKQLQQKSEVRVGESEKFAEQVKKINHYVEQKNLKSVSLNKAEFMERRRQLNAEKEDEKAIEDQVLPKKEIERNYYLDEVLRITTDYMELLSKNS